MNSRSVVAVAATALCLVGTNAAHAAKPKPKPKPKPVCNLVTDPATDAGTPNDSSLDVTSADVATDATRLTMVVRVTKLVTSDTSSPTGQTWTFSFDVGAGHVGLTINNGPLGGNYPRNSTGTLDTGKNEIRVTIPLNQLTAKVVPGSVLRNLHVDTSRSLSLDRSMGIGDSLAFTAADNAMSTKTYVAGTPSCVKVGQ
jgi:hypothetical protein